MKSETLFNLKFSWKTALPYSFLMGISLLYESLILLRLFLYKNKILKTMQPSIPVISVGNLTVGGTGKTPVVDFLIHSIQEKKLRPTILSRGYGRHSKSTIQRLRIDETIPSSATSIGDEPYLLATHHPQVPVYAGSKRTLSAKLALIWDHPDIFILDDAYQHLAISRDLNLLLIDAERGLGNRRLLPLGQLREPEHHWDRADAIIMTKCNLGFSDRLLHQLKTQLKVTCPIFKFDYRPQKLVRLDRQLTLHIKELAGKSIMVSSGIAQPKGFALMLQQAGAQIIETRNYPDHHPYSEENRKELLNLFERIRPDYWITTEKDAVKLQTDSRFHTSLWIAEMKIVSDSSWNEFFIDFLEKGTVK